MNKQHPHGPSTMSPPKKPNRNPMKSSESHSMFKSPLSQKYFTVIVSQALYLAAIHLYFRKSRMATSSFAFHTVDLFRRSRPAVMETAFLWICLTVFSWSDSNTLAGDTPLVTLLSPQGPTQRHVCRVVAFHYWTKELLQGVSIRSTFFLWNQWVMVG